MEEAFSLTGLLTAGRSGDGESLCRQVDIRPAEVEQLFPAGSGVGGDAEEGTQPVARSGVEEGPELGHAAGTGFGATTTKGRATIRETSRRGKQCSSASM
jgi:hypothetical protein